MNNIKVVPCALEHKAKGHEIKSFLPQQIEVQFVQAGHTLLTKHNAPPFTAHQYYRLNLFDDAMDIEFGSTMRTLQGPFVVQQYDGSTFTVYPQSPCSMYYAAFRVFLFGAIDITHALSSYRAYPLSAQEYSLLHPLLLRLVHENSACSRETEYIRDSMLRAVIATLWEPLGMSGLQDIATQRCPVWLALTLQEMRHNPDITVEQLAQLTGYSIAQYRRLFQQYVGVSPREYLRQHRLTLAKRLLSTSCATVASIAHELGFASASNFTWFFTQMTGCSPTAFRDRNRQLADHVRE